MSVPVDLRRVREVFDTLVELDDSTRRQRLQDLWTTEPHVASEVEGLMRQALDDCWLDPLILIEDEEGLARVSEPFVRVGDVLQTPLGDVRVERVLSDPSRNGTAEVYEATHADAGRVAVKILLTTGMGYEERRRFAVEAEALRMLDHPNIARLLGAGVIRRADGRGALGLVTRFVRGWTLDEWARGRTVGEIARVMEDVARAVHTIHQRPLLHRDLKPSNIIVGEDDRPVVIDLGVAKFLDHAPSELASMGGAVTGTPRYMAPEQFTPTARAVDVRADIYALGAVLHELISGEPLVDVAGCSEAEALERKLRARPVAPRGLNERAQVLRVAHAAAQPEASARYASAEALAEDLARARSGRPIAARPLGAMARGVMLVRRRPWPAVAVGVTVLALAGGSGVYVMTQREVEASRQRAEARFDDTRRFARWVIFDLTNQLGFVPGSAQARRALIEEASRTLDALASDPIAGDDLLLELAEARARLGEVLAIELGDRAGALVQYTAALALLSRHTSPQDRERAMLSAWVEYEHHHVSSFETPQPLEEALPTTERTIGTFDRLEGDLRGDARLYRWRSRVLIMYSRRLLERSAPAERVRGVLERAVSDADRAADLAPHDALAAAQPVHARFWLAHALFDLGDAGALAAADLALEAARGTRARQHPLGIHMTARGMLLRCRLLARGGDIETFAREAVLSVEEADLAMALDPHNLIMTRTAEALRSQLVYESLTAGMRGLTVPLDLTEAWLDTCIALYESRRLRGWSSPFEDAKYPQNYANKRLALNRLKRGEGVSNGEPVSAPASEPASETQGRP